MNDLAYKPFYVKYLPLPGALRRFLLVLLPLLLLALVAVGAVLAWRQGYPGTGQWKTGEAVTLEGDLILTPYPALRLAEGQTPSPIILVVSDAKAGAPDVVVRNIGSRVRLTGHAIQRGTHLMLEVADNAAIDVLGPAAPAPHDVTSLGTHTLRGQIIDPKCFLGVMRPGEGKVHKGCATRCIAGGIPPMFLTRADDPGRHAALYLLTDSEGHPIRDAILPFVADAIEVTGAVERRGEVLLFKIDPATIRWCR